MHSFRPAFKRTLQAIASFSSIVLGQRRCNLCQSPVQIDMIDHNTSESTHNILTSLPQSIYLRVACPNCKPYIVEFISVLLMHKCTRTFLLESPRVLSTPSTIDTWAGQEAIRSHLLDLNSSKRLTIMTHPRTLQVMATFLET